MNLLKNFEYASIDQLLDLFEIALKANDDCLIEEIREFLKKEFNRNANTQFISAKTSLNTLFFEGECPEIKEIEAKRRVSNVINGINLQSINSEEDLIIILENSLTMLRK